MCFDFIFSHKNKQDSSFIAETEKEIDGLRKKKDELEKNLKKNNEDERSKTLEYNSLRQKIEMEKDVKITNRKTRS